MSLFRLIAGALAPLTLLGAVLAYLHPEWFMVFGAVFKWLFAATMLALGVVLQPEDLAATLARPGRIAAGVATQFTLMPLLGFAIAYFGDLSPALALGFVVVACAPGAMASNVIVFLAGGAVAYSVALTTVATLLAPLLTPSLVEWIGGVFLPIPFWPMVQTIVLIVVLPLLAGMLLRRRLGHARAGAEAIAPAVATLAIVVICSYAVAANQARIAEVGPRLFLYVVALNAAGYAGGWLLARLYGFDPRHRLTLAIEIGMQNAGLGVVLALEHFADRPETALPGALFAVWCILTSAGATTWLRRARRRAALAAT